MHVMILCMYFCCRLCLWQQTDAELMEKLKHNKEQLDVPSSCLYWLANEELFGNNDQCCIKNLCGFVRMCYCTWCGQSSSHHAISDNSTRRL